MNKNYIKYLVLKLDIKETVGVVDQIYVTESVDGMEMSQARRACKGDPSNFLYTSTVESLVYLRCGEGFVVVLVLPEVSKD